MRLALGHSVEWDKVYALIIFNSETTKRQSRFLPTEKRELAKASVVYEHAVKRNGRCIVTRVRRA
jgi:superfamily II DNA helicase RecQ